MFSGLLVVTTLVCFISSEPIGSDGPVIHGDRNGLKLYGNKDVNNVVEEIDKRNPLKERKQNLIDSLQPLSPQDLKCMMSEDHNCSKNMLKIKEVLIQALENDCKKCTNDEKVKAGFVIASLMACHPVAWKLFLTRYNGLSRVQRNLG